MLSVLRSVPASAELDAFRAAVAPSSSTERPLDGDSSSSDGDDDDDESSPLLVRADAASADHQRLAPPLDARRGVPLTPIAASDTGSEYATDDGEEHMLEVTDAGELYSALAQLQDTAGWKILNIFEWF